MYQENGGRKLSRASFISCYAQDPQNLFGPAVKNRVAGISYGMFMDIQQPVPTVASRSLVLRGLYLPVANETSSRAACILFFSAIKASAS